MTQLTRKGVKFQWTEKCKKSFQELKQKLISAPVLAIPEGSEVLLSIVMHRNKVWDVY